MYLVKFECFLSTAMSSIIKYIPSFSNMKMFLSKEDDDPFESIEDAEVFSVSYLNSFIMFVGK